MFHLRYPAAAKAKPFSHTDYLATERFDGLTGIRALAALAVVFFHYGGPILAPLQGWIAVQLFFVLSGFLITTLALREEDRTGRLSLATFYVRRGFRIIPVYLTLLAATALFVTIGGSYRSSRLADAMPFYLSFGNELVDYNTPYAMSWTLGVEEKFYLVWPLLLALTAVLKTGKHVVRPAGSVALLAGTLFLVLPRTPAESWANLSVHYTSLLTGCVLAMLLHHPRTFSLLRPLTRPVATVPVAAAFCVCQLSVTPLRDLVGGNWRFIPIYAGACALLLIAVVAPGPVQRVLSGRLLRFIGDRSYALYLCQVMAAAVTGLAFAPGIGKAIATSALALAFACVVHRWIEVPAIGMGRRMARRIRLRHTARHLVRL